MSVRTRLATMLIALYPAAWRARYQIEIRALIADDPPTLRGLASLLLGAADAHAHPSAAWTGQLARAARLRNSVCALFTCWLLVSLLGLGFRKETEEARFGAAAAHHVLLGLAETAVIAGAGVGMLAVAVGGLPLLARALSRALSARDRRTTLVLLAAPVAAGAGFLALTLLLATLAPSRGRGFPAGFVLTILVPWQIAALACVGVCAWAPRAVLARVEMPIAALRRAGRAGTILTAAMVLIALALWLYAAGIWLQAPRLAGVASGPFGAGTAAMLSGEALAASLAAALAAVITSRIRTAAAASG